MAIADVLVLRCTHLTSILTDALHKKCLLTGKPARVWIPARGWSLILFLSISGGSVKVYVKWNRDAATSGTAEHVCVSGCHRGVVLFSTGVQRDWWCLGLNYALVCRWRSSSPGYPPGVYSWGGHWIEANVLKGSYRWDGWSKRWVVKGVHIINNFPRVGPGSPRHLHSVNSLIWMAQEWLSFSINILLDCYLPYRCLMDDPDHRTIALSSCAPLFSRTQKNPRTTSKCQGRFPFPLGAFCICL